MPQHHRVVPCLPPCRQLAGYVLGDGVEAQAKKEGTLSQCLKMAMGWYSETRQGGTVPINLNRGASDIFATKKSRLSNGVADNPPVSLVALYTNCRELIKQPQGESSGLY